MYIGVEELCLPVQDGSEKRNLCDNREANTHIIQPDELNSERGLWSIPLCSVLGGAPRLHFCAQNLLRHQYRLLSWAEEVHCLDLYRAADGLRCCHVFFDFLGCLCKGKEASGLY